MSGPKVVRIVTREERIARCECQLARLDAAIEAWRQLAEQIGTPMVAELAATEARRDALREALARDRFQDVEQGAAADVEFLNKDREARLEHAAAAAAREQTARRRARSAAVSTLEALERAGKPVPGALREDLEAMAAGQTRASSVLAQAFQLLSQGEAQGLSDRQRALADALKAPRTSPDTAAALDALPQSADDATLARLERHLADVSTLLGADAAAPFEQRLVQLTTEAPSARRGLLIDSLQLDLSAAVALARRRDAIQMRLRLAAAELLATQDAAAARLAQSILDALQGSVEELESLEASATATLQRVHSGLAARARRRAVLTGLAELGYQVTEDLETAWVREGRIVLRRASQPDYGVELGGGGEATRLQIRPVAFRDGAAPADLARDRDAETIACDHVTELQAQVAEAGGAIVIEQALGLGQAPVKVIATPRTNPEERHLPPPTQNRERTIDP